MKHDHDSAQKPQIAHKQPRRKWCQTVKIERVRQVCELFKQTQTTISERAIARYLGTTHATLVSDPVAAALVNKYKAEQNNPAPRAKQESTEPPITTSWEQPSWTPQKGAEIELVERRRQKMGWRPMVGEE